MYPIHDNTDYNITRTKNNKLFIQNKIYKIKKLRIEDATNILNIYNDQSQTSSSQTTNTNTLEITSNPNKTQSIPSTYDYNLYMKIQ